MKWCVQFPEETILIIRPCLIAICMGNRPAAKLLNALLYRYSIRKEHKEDAENINENKQARGKAPDQDTSYRIYRKQSQLVADMCGEMTEKTLHDVAVPALQLLGYLDLEESMKANCYILHVDAITEALGQYDPEEGLSSRLEKFLISSLRLEKFLISSEEKIDKKNFQSRLEKVLIWNRNSSNYHRGRKASPEAASEGKSKNPRMNRDSNREKESNKESLDFPLSSSHSLSSVPLENATAEQLYARLNQLEQQNPELEQLFTPTTELSPSVEKPLPIASPTTENAEPRTVRKTDELQPALNLEEVRARGYWNRLGFIEKAASAKHWKTLAEHTKTFEQFESLFEYTRAQIEKDPRITKKEVNPGNMVREITGWKQEENRKLAQRVQPEQTRPMSLAERNREKMRLAGMIVPAVTGRN